MIYELVLEGVSLEKTWNSLFAIFSSRNLKLKISEI